jgi:hypothetical protein
VDERDHFTHLALVFGEQTAQADENDFVKLGFDPLLRDIREGPVVVG